MLKKMGRALIVVPPTLIDYWKYEIERWTPDCNLSVATLPFSKQ
jgi:SNF2 family DNA or RNA helicase